MGTWTDELLSLCLSVVLLLFVVVLEIDFPGNSSRCEIHISSLLAYGLGDFE